MNTICFGKQNTTVTEPKGVKVLKNVIKTTFTPTGDVNIDTERVKCYAKSVGMDAANTKAAVIMTTQGVEAGIKAMFTGDNGEELSYSEMRSRYG